jgi:GT2 family glycosyltransferase
VDWKRITIGVCLKNIVGTEIAAFRSISIQDYPHKLMKLVTVCENIDEQNVDLTKTIESCDIKTVILSSEGRGLGFSRQMVVENAEGDYLVWVDDDFVLQEDFIRKHVEFMENNPLSGAALAKELPYNNALVTKLGIYLTVIGRLSPKVPPSGGFEIYRLDAINQAGGYDKMITGAGEDIDIARRISYLGWQLCRNSESVFSRKDTPSSWKELWFKCYWYGYANKFLRKKHQSKIQWEFFPLLAFCIGLRNSGRVYRECHEKEAFFLCAYDLFRSVARLEGFLKARNK